MIRIARYSTSAAAIVLLLAAGAWWMLFSQGTTNAWAELIEQVAGVQRATCNLHTYRNGDEQISKVYLEGSRVRVEDSSRFYITDFLDGKSLYVEKWTKTARISEMREYPGQTFVLGGNPLIDLIQMKNVTAERLPDERIDDIPCQVYRVKDTTFMGDRVPWVKVWLDPESKLPVQIHSVVGDRSALTLKDFHWDEPFDEGLLELVVPEGYELLGSPGSEEAPQDVAPPRPVEAASDEAGVEIPADEIAKTLDMLAQRIEANYKAIDSWSGTYDVMEQYRHTRDPRYEQISHSEVEFFVEPGRDRIRINNREVELVRIVGNDYITPASELSESRWVRTPEELLRFPVSDLRHTVEGFPRVEGFQPGQAFRVLYREPPKAAEQYTFQGYIDPLVFFGRGTPYWKACSNLAGVLRGDRGSDDMEFLKKGIAIRVYREEGSTEYVLTQQMKSVGSAQLEFVFSSEAGFNVVSMKFSRLGQDVETRQYKFRKEQGVFIPTDVEHKSYGDGGDKQPTQHRVYTLKQTRVNEPIDPAMFEVQTMGLQRGDRFVDRIERRMAVFDGEELVLASEFKLQPASEFKLQPAAEAAQEDDRRAQSTNNMKQVTLAMHNYHDKHKHFPPAYVADKDGKPLLSWRVLMLPYLRQNDLYEQFHLDEPWDSQHNKQLIARMPTFYESPDSTVSGEWKTNYLTVRGEGTVFPGKKPIRFAEIRDGTSNTIVLVEVHDDRAVIWTKPDDFEYDPRDPMKDLVDSSSAGFLAGLADGSVRFVWSSTEPTVLKAFFTRDGGEKVGTEALGR